jgi:hypothetical protein
MQQLLYLGGSVAAILGICLCTMAGLARVSGLYYLAGFEATSIFTAGIGMMVFACLVKLEALLAQSREK